MKVKHAVKTWRILKLTWIRLNSKEYCSTRTQSARMPETFQCKWRARGMSSDDETFVVTRLGNREVSVTGQLEMNSFSSIQSTSLESQPYISDTDPSLNRTEWMPIVLPVVLSVRSLGLWKRKESGKKIVLQTFFPKTLWRLSCHESSDGLWWSSNTRNNSLPFGKTQDPREVQRHPSSRLSLSIDTQLYWTRDEILPGMICSCLCCKHTILIEREIGSRLILNERNILEIIGELHFYSMK